MSSPNFPFIPRKLAKSSRHVEDLKKLRTTQTSHRQPDAQSEQRNATSASHSERREEKYLNDNSYTALFELALSDYELWSNTDLLATIEANEDGYIPISHLVRTSSVFAGLSTIPPETVLMHCVRSSSVLEGRFIVSEPSSSGWGGARSGRFNDSEGGFEVRRRDWAKMKARIRKYTSFHWDNRTIYFENLPYHARLHHAVHEFVQQLLSPRKSSKGSHSLLIQSISFPRHHKDAPSAPPPAVGKGFAFIVLSHTKDADYLLGRWPWRIDERPNSSCEDETRKEIQEAKDYGFRCMSKRRWDELKEEYLALQRRLLERTLSANGPSTSNVTQSTTTTAATPVDQEGSKTPLNMDNQRDTKHDAEQTAWFPKDCLVFVKNVHPETNKTTLRALFSCAFNHDASAIDYVDYNKGLDSCYLRLSNSEQAQTLVSSFSEHKTVQSNALDNVGETASSGASIEMELVRGKKEEVYWERVPEKIRQAALAKASGQGDDQSRIQEKGEAGATGRKRKRRKWD